MSLAPPQNLAIAQAAGDFAAARPRPAADDDRVYTLARAWPLTVSRLDAHPRST